MKPRLVLVGSMAAMFLLGGCATQMKRGPQAVTQKPRDVSLVYFDFNRSEMKGDQQNSLDQAVEELKQNPHWVAQVEGHADAIGSTRYNVRLGDKRARSVKEAMVLEGVSPEQLIILSFGEEKPIASNQTEEGRAKNRRVEVKVR